MKRSFLGSLTLSLLILFSQTSYAGFHVGNGGDALKCTAGTASPFVGTYSLDYVLTYQSSNNNGDIIKVRTLSESFARVGKILSGLPTLKKSFDLFSSTYRNTDPRTGRVWEEAPFGLTDLKDEKMVSLVPKNCRKGDKLELIQAVIRQDPQFSGNRELIVYKYFPSVLRELEEKAPLQASFLLVHEWLWDISQNVDRNRRVNRFLHSSEASQMSPTQLQEKLESLGISIPGEQPPVFEDKVCPVDQGLNPLEAFIAKKSDSSPPFVFGKFALFTRKKNCFPKNKCRPDWIVEKDGFALLVGEKPLVVVRKVTSTSLEFYLTSRVNMRQLNCIADLKTGATNCDEMQSVDENEFSLGAKSLKFSGVTSSECLRLTSSIDLELDDGSALHYQFVIFSKSAH